MLSEFEVKAIVEGTAVHEDMFVNETVSEFIARRFAEQAEMHAIELRAYEATVQNLEQRIRELESQRVPEGWKLVPEIATDRMVSVGMDEDHRLDACDAAILWTVMLAAAPKKEGE